MENNEKVYGESLLQISDKATFNRPVFLKSLFDQPVVDEAIPDKFEWQFTTLPQETVVYSKEEADVMRKAKITLDESMSKLKHFEGNIPVIYVSQEKCIDRETIDRLFKRS
jgi:hypothetical protein